MGAEENTQDALSVLVSVISFAAAVMIVAYALLTTRNMNNVVSDRIDEKQSITTTYDYDIASAHMNKTDKAVTKSQVFDMILSLDDTSITVTINGVAIPRQTLINAKKGIKTSVVSIKNALINDSYYMKTIYDTEDGNDFIVGLQFSGI